jgi:hypothetical protein
MLEDNQMGYVQPNYATTYFPIYPSKEETEAKEQRELRERLVNVALDHMLANSETFVREAIDMAKELENYILNK